MKKSTSAASPNEYVAALDGWRRTCVEELRATVQSASALEEVIKHMMEAGSINRTARGRAGFSVE